jgi:hypothetical protein
MSTYPFDTEPDGAVADSWFNSIQATIFAERIQERAAGDTPWGRTARKIINQDTFGERINDRAHVTSIYRGHNEAVRATIPQERLLVYEVSEGWGPLCHFLGVAVPKALSRRTTPQKNSGNANRTVPRPRLFRERGRHMMSARRCPLRAQQSAVGEDKIKASSYQLNPDIAGLIAHGGLAP